ncbi:hypothetical protein WN51_02562 [Melipona quadrifasciata]|uniref:Uncharacterized protein n=1 Tax=Melipona quadrifasciata TaxID=166423 RepID=A0A0M8ZUX4_9HYME|nr:hypothetical protein WN51_02562 [Melipona quadrifasciata]
MRSLDTDCVILSIVFLKQETKLTLSTLLPCPHFLSNKEKILKISSRYNPPFLDIVTVIFSLVVGRLTNRKGYKILRCSIVSNIRSAGYNSQFSSKKQFKSARHEILVRIALQKYFELVGASETPASEEDAGRMQRGKHSTASTIDQSVRFETMMHCLAVYQENVLLFFSNRIVRALFFLWLLLPSKHYYVKGKYILHEMSISNDRYDRNLKYKTARLVPQCLQQATDSCSYLELLTSSPPPEIENRDESENEWLLPGFERSFCGGLKGGVMRPGRACPWRKKKKKQQQKQQTKAGSSGMEMKSDRIEVAVGVLATAFTVVVAGPQIEIISVNILVTLNVCLCSNNSPMELHYAFKTPPSDLDFPLIYLVAGQYLTYSIPRKFHHDNLKANNPILIYHKEHSLRSVLLRDLKKFRNKVWRSGKTLADVIVIDVICIVTDDVSASGRGHLLGKFESRFMALAGICVIPAEKNQQEDWGLGWLIRTGELRRLWPRAMWHLPDENIETKFALPTNLIKFVSRNSVRICSASGSFTNGNRGLRGKGGRCFENFPATPNTNQTEQPKRSGSDTLSAFCTNYRILVVSALHLAVSLAKRCVSRNERNFINSMSADRAERPAESLAENEGSVKREKRSACGVSAASGTAAWKRVLKLPRLNIYALFNDTGEGPKIAGVVLWSIKEQQLLCHRPVGDGGVTICGGIGYQEKNFSHLKLTEIYEGPGCKFSKLSTREGCEKNLVRVNWFDGGNQVSSTLFSRGSRQPLSRIRNEQARALLFYDASSERERSCLGPTARPKYIKKSIPVDNKRLEAQSLIPHLAHVAIKPMFTLCSEWGFLKLSKFKLVTKSTANESQRLKFSLFKTTFLKLAVRFFFVSLDFKYQARKYIRRCRIEYYADQVLLNRAT